MWPSKISFVEIGYDQVSTEDQNPDFINYDFHSPTMTTNTLEQIKIELARQCGISTIAAIISYFVALLALITLAATVAEGAPTTSQSYEKTDYLMVAESNTRAKAAYDYLHDHLDLFSTPDNNICHISARGKYYTYYFNMSDIDVGTISTTETEISMNDIFIGNVPSLSFEILKGKRYALLETGDKKNAWKWESDGRHLVLLEKNGNEDKIMRATNALAMECGAEEPPF